MKTIKWFVKRFHISFVELAVTFTWVFIFAALFYAINIAGLKLAELHTEGYAFLEHSVQ